MSALIDFYLEKSPTNDHLWFSEILATSNENWEHCHSFIQWIFPLDERSNFNSDAPVLTEEDMKEFRSNEVIRKNVQTIFVRALDFFLPEGKKPHWVVYNDHNHLRITRIIKSLKLMGFPDHAQAFYKAVIKINTKYKFEMNQYNTLYWHEAAQ